MSGYSPKVIYKNLLRRQEKLLMAIDDPLALPSKPLDADNKSLQKLTLVVELFTSEDHNLKACVASLALRSNEIDHIYFLHDGVKNKGKQTEPHLINTQLVSLLLNSSLAYSLDSKENFINNLANVNGDVVLWCQKPVVFYTYSFKAFLDSYNGNVKVPGIIYSDHDLLRHGTRTAPAFKPALNIDWLLCNNYMGKVILFDKAQLVAKVKNMSLSLNGIYEEDADFLHTLLNIFATDPLCLIKHLPLVLYSEQSIALNKEHQPMLNNEAELAIKRINWPLPDPLPLVSIIIPTRNGKQLVQQCIESFYQFTDYNNVEVLLIDNESDDVEAIKYFQQLAKDNKVKLLNYNAPFNYSAINNFAVQYAKGDVLLFMNNDIELLHEKWLEEMVMQVMRADIGCVGAKLYYPNMTIQHAGVIVGLWGCAGHSHKYFKRADKGYMNRLSVVQNYSAVTAACMAVRKNVFDEVNGFNEEDLSVSFNDVDLCLKIQAKGYRNLWTPYAEMIHHESISRGAENTPEKKAREAKEIAYMRNTWHLDTQVDPAYNPWLTHQKEDFSFAREKR